MDRYKRSTHSGWRLAVNCAILLLGYAATGRARALDNEADMHADLFYLYDETHDLGLPDEARGEYGLNLRPRLYTSLSEEWHSFVSLQLFYATDTVDLSTDEFDQARASDRFAELRQLWIEWGGLTDYPGETLRAGRERLRMDDGLVLDSDIVAARWAWDTTLLKGGIGVAEEVDTFRTDDSELSPVEDNLRRTYAIVRWQYRYNSFVSAHVIDTDGSDNTVNAPQLTWSGVSFDNGYFDFRARQPWQYYFGFYGVNGHETRDGEQVGVNGWAVDGGMRWRSGGNSGFNLGTQVSFTDDKPDGYRQTGLQSNRAYYLGARTRLHRFNEALRADFRNIGVATAYVGLLPDKSPWEIGFAGHTLFLRDEHGQFSARGYSGRPNGTDRDIGRALDLVVSWYWEKNDSVMADDVRMDSYLRLILSGFFPGKAFDAGGEDRQVNRASIEWAVTF